MDTAVNNNLIKIDENRDIEYSGFKLHKTGITPVGTPTYEQWANLGQFLSKSENALTWWVGDWANFGEHSYNEYTQEFGEDRWKYNTFSNAKWLSSQFENISRRRESLTPAHHREVLALQNIIRQNYWLDFAEKKNLTVKELRVFVQEEKKDHKFDDIDDRKPVVYGDNIFYLSTKWQGSREDSYKVIKDGEKYPTLKRRSWFYHEDGSEFTLREYAQVQDFPDTYKFVGTYEKIKDQIGNAVSPKMAQFVGKEIQGKTVGDLFAGCGGLSCGLEMLGKEARWAVERNVAYARTYKFNHPDSKVITRDIKKLDPEMFERVDVIVGGPPCQGFSLSGMRFKDDPRNELYKEFVRFVKVLEPGEFILENVPQVQQVKEEIIKDFSELGYRVTTKLVKGEEIGMRQDRHRFFFIGKK